MNKTHAIDYANIGLMLLSALIAFIIPFELFLFSYAILGPLHYMTEIGWLHQRKYFATGKYDYLFLILMGVLITYASFVKGNALAGKGEYIIMMAFVAGFAMFVFKDIYLKVITVVMAFVATFFIEDGNSYMVSFFGIFLPTIIHVFLFTSVFMLFGALKSRSTPGIISVALLFVLAILMLTIDKNGTHLNLKYNIKAWGAGFDQLNLAIMKFLGWTNTGTNMARTDYINTVFRSNAGFMVARFVAFAYTYHYLNWFSKTSIIKWHKVPFLYLVITIAVWIIAVGTYMLDYKKGLNLLFFLSFLHVLLEFPLNFQSFIGIGKEIGNRFTGKVAKA